MPNEARAPDPRTPPPPAPKGVGAALREMLRATARGDMIARPLNYARRLGAAE